ncbi:F-box/RNI-like superfamily protein [Rhynchospora pubera]|uniref:F-box/RNI-like superfamily protein n=1 Tax=Rhynchospora pubera TaxID=906938 RepID=A0AAV8DEJ9_9POAL|nr:F-box/RNI-like superfamily protein [Rhynchospora pubera]
MVPKDAVQTCILSKQWRNLWTFIPSLNFDKFRFKCTDAAFVHFVTNMLYFHGASKLDAFRLRWYTDQHLITCIYREEMCQIHVSNVSSWIFSALSCKPRSISLVLRGFANLKLPLALFTCTSLEQLDLQFIDSSKKDIHPKFINLPNLKKLKFFKCALHNLVMQGILSGCPLLEELNLHDCSLEFSEMKSDLLRRLSIIKCQGNGVVDIFMPSLISLHLEDHCPGITKLSLKNTPSLVKVFVSYDFFDENYISGAEFELFNCLTTVTDLKLHGPGLEELLEKVILNCPKFDCLKQLTFGHEGAIIKKPVLLCQLLRHTPNLQKLTISQKQPATSGEPKKMGATGQIPFRCDHLKAIEIKYSDPSGVQELVDVLLQNVSHDKGVRIDFSRF